MSVYDPAFKILLVVVGLTVLLLTCGGCGGAKHLKIQVPALLDIEVEYHDRTDDSEVRNLKGIFQKTQD